MIRKIAFKNLWHKPLSTLLCLGLLTLSVSIISLILILQHDLEKKFENDLKDIDMVIGANGSPLQLVLSAIYHIDAPTGNINLGKAEKLMKNPMVQQAIPLAYGDSYRGYRILGTDHTYLEKYEVELKEGRYFQHSMEAVLGASVAQSSGLKIGDTFLGSHGEGENGHLHDHHSYKVVGISKYNNSVIDNLILTSIPSVWMVHNTHHSSEEQHHVHNDHQHENSSTQNSASALLINTDSMDITAVLISFKSKRALLQFPRIINELNGMQAVNPVIEINRLFSLIGVGATTLRLIAGGIMLLSGFSLFFILYNRLEDRKYEMAMLRAVGYRPIHLIWLLLWEGLILSVIGYVLGFGLSRIGLYLINRKASADFNLTFSHHYHNSEIWILGLTIALGILAALIPTLRTLKMDVSKILAKH